jgi:hypothetical protein
MNWLDKVRDYERLFAEYQRIERINTALRLEYAVSLKTGLHFTEKYMQAKKELSELTKLQEDNFGQCGRRLKWKSGNVDFVVIVGNPVTYIEANLPATDKEAKEGYSIDVWDDISVCKRGDQFDWKKGVIQALFNFFREHVQDSDIQSMMQRDLYAKYPELK